MKDGRTHLAHKAEHAVDMESGAVIAVTLRGADQGDTTSIEKTLEEVTTVFEEVLSDREASESLSPQLRSEVVADKGYHSNEVLTAQREAEVRTYINEPKRRRRKWRGKEKAKAAVYGNRRRIRGVRGRRLLRQRGALLERPFAHCYETGGMRRTHLRGHENIRKRLLVHVAGFNLSLLMRQRFGVGKPRALQGLLVRLFDLFEALLEVLIGSQRPRGPFSSSRQLQPALVVAAG